MKKKITVLYLGRKGAGGPYSLEMSKALIQKECSLQCIVSAYAENIEQWRKLSESNLNKIELIEVKTYRNKIGFALSLINAFKYRSIARKIQSFGPDFVYIPMLSLLSSLITKHLYKTTPIVTTIHDISQHSGEENSLVEKLDGKTISHSTNIVVLSKQFIDLVNQKYQIPTSKISHIPHANFTYYQKENFAPDFEKTRNKTIFFGRIIKYKGLEVLLRAMEIVVRQKPEIKLKIAGSGSLSEDEQNLITKLYNNIDNQIRWISEEEVDEMFSDVDFTILPYIEASQSGVIPLSYSFGKCAVVSNIGGLPEQVTPGTGILVEPANVQKLADTILYLYNNPSELLQLNKQAYSYATTELSWDKSAELLLDNVKIDS